MQSSKRAASDRRGVCFEKWQMELVDVRVGRCKEGSSSQMEHGDGGDYEVTSTWHPVVVCAGGKVPATCRVDTGALLQQQIADRCLGAFGSFHAVSGSSAW